MLPNFLVALLALTPAAAAAAAASGPDFRTRTRALGTFGVQRLRQVCGQPGCYTDLFVNGKTDYIPGAWSFDAHCQIRDDGAWTACDSQVPYTPPGRLFVKMDAWNKASQTYTLWFSAQYNEGDRVVNATARMEVERPVGWDVSQCRQMDVVSKEYI
ncbi:hypothetical protein ISF_00479 [Cordyceps fumosorosea ARSEF 2679]|uniref:Uncharacterized protein n=1 Tax=Cordyceps fumosorosea (strain ARSEF 2679) TaxID=1081104 RepID=A0A168EAI2_CORFA|nr:hypothetical protein ISF_00479 [Cordyceps fumosorosea ARSEF 2679]OAA73578.1 hypothetical protein ISF_00479 [Cordyceps fumosorosea ARSEF 2679]